MVRKSGKPIKPGSMREIISSFVRGERYEYRRDAEGFFSKAE